MDGTKAAIFRSLTKEQRNAIRKSMGAPAAIKPGEYLFRLGDIGADMIEIVEGRVEVSVLTVDALPLVLGYCGPGDVVGEIGPILGGARTASVRAVEPTKFRRLSRDAFWRVLEEYPSVALDALRLVAERLQTATLDARGLYTVADKRPRTRRWDQFSDSILAFAARPFWTFFHVIFFTVWLWWNWHFSSGVDPKNLPWWVPDPPPFGMLTMVVSLEAIFLAILVLVGQNKQTEQTNELKREESRQFNQMNELIAQTRVAVEEIRRKLPK